MASLCCVEVAAVRAEPRDGAERMTELLRGEPVTVGELREGWAQVRTAYDYPGWVRETALAPDSGSNPGMWLPGPTRRSPVDVARTYLGARYLWGGMTERGIDCSGLVHMAHRSTGRLIPRDADQQEEAGEPVDDDEAHSGDLVTYGEESATHIAFWLGEGRILHSTERDGVDGVVEEREPDDLRARRRRFVRF